MARLAWASGLVAVLGAGVLLAWPSGPGAPRTEPTPAAPSPGPGPARAIPVLEELPPAASAPPAEPAAPERDPRRAVEAYRLGAAQRHAIRAERRETRRLERLQRHEKERARRERRGSRVAPAEVKVVPVEAPPPEGTP